MSVFTAMDFSPPADRRRAVALLCVFVSHLGVFYWIATARFFSERRADVQRNEIELKFSIVPPRPVRPTATVQRPPTSAPRIRRSKPVPLVPTTPQEPVSPAQTSEAATAPALDLDKLKQSAVAIALADMKSKAAPEKPGAEQDNAIGKAISQASRPKCDNNYKPNVAGVALDGLMKLPALVGSALTDKGCKW